MIIDELKVGVFGTIAPLQVFFLTFHSCRSSVLELPLFPLSLLMDICWVGGGRNKD